MAGLSSEMCIRDRDYIVGVATAADSRHRGHMRDVLMKMLGDMHQDRKPFCYLMPASPDIYRPFGFRYIFDLSLIHIYPSVLPGDF